MSLLSKTSLTAHWRLLHVQVLIVYIIYAHYTNPVKVEKVEENNVHCLEIWRLVATNRMLCYYTSARVCGLNAYT